MVEMGAAKVGTWMVAARFSDENKQRMKSVFGLGISMGLGFWVLSFGGLVLEEREEIRKREMRKVERAGAWDGYGEDGSVGFGFQGFGEQRGHEEKEEEGKGGFK